ALDAQRRREGLHQGCGADDVLLDQELAQPLAGGLLLAERAVELLGRDDALLDERLADAHPFHAAGRAAHRKLLTASAASAYCSTMAPTSVRSNTSRNVSLAPQSLSDWPLRPRASCRSAIASSPLESMNAIADASTTKRPMLCSRTCSTRP